MEIEERLLSPHLESEIDNDIEDRREGFIEELEEDSKDINTLISDSDEIQRNYNSLESLLDIVYSLESDPILLKRNYNFISPLLETISKNYNLNLSLEGYESNLTYSLEKLEERRKNIFKRFVEFIVKVCKSVSKYLGKIYDSNNLMKKEVASYRKNLSSLPNKDLSILDWTGSQERELVDEKIHNWSKRFVCRIDNSSIIDGRVKGIGAAFKDLKTALKYLTSRNFIRNVAKATIDTIDATEKMVFEGVNKLARPPKFPIPNKYRTTTRDINLVPFRIGFYLNPLKAIFISEIKHLFIDKTTKLVEVRKLLPRGDEGYYLCLEPAFPGGYSLIGYFHPGEDNPKEFNGKTLPEFNLNFVKSIREDLEKEAVFEDISPIIRGVRMVSRGVQPIERFRKLIRIHGISEFTTSLPKNRKDLSTILKNIDDVIDTTNGLRVLVDKTLETLEKRVSKLEAKLRQKDDLSVESYLFSYLRKIIISLSSPFTRMFNVITSFLRTNLAIVKEGFTLLKGLEKDRRTLMEKAKAKVGQGVIENSEKIAVI